MVTDKQESAFLELGAKVLGLGESKIFVMSLRPPFILDTVSYKQLPDVLYNQGDVFVSPTMGDAFNIPCLEALACGLPVITTNFGGQVDYVNDKNGWLIDYDLVPVTWDINYESNQWAKPNIGMLRKTLRFCYENRDKVIAKKEEARKTAELCTWDRSAQMLLDVMTNLD